MLAYIANVYTVYIVQICIWRFQVIPRREKSIIKNVYLGAKYQVSRWLLILVQNTFPYRSIMDQTTFLTSLRDLVLLLFMKCCSITVPQVTMTIELIVPIETKGFQRRGKVGCSVILPLLTCSKKYKKTCRIKKILGFVLPFLGSHRVLEYLSEEYPKQRENKSCWCLTLSYSSYIWIFIRHL